MDKKWVSGGSVGCIPIPDRDDAFHLGEVGINDLVGILSLGERIRPAGSRKDVAGVEHACMFSRCLYRMDNLVVVPPCHPGSRENREIRRAECSTGDSDGSGLGLRLQAHSWTRDRGRGCSGHIRCIGGCFLGRQSRGRCCRNRRGTGVASVVATVGTGVAGVVAAGAGVVCWAHPLAATSSITRIQNPIDFFMCIPLIPPNN